MKRVLVTGGSRGLGLEICKLLLARKYRVVTNSRQTNPELEQLAKDFPGCFSYHSVDLTKSGSVKTFARDADLLGGIDGFVANAAVGFDGLLTLSSESGIRDCIELNLVSNILLAREVIKGMLNHGGSLVFVSSIAAKKGLKGLSVYSATKGALLSFSRSIAREYGGHGIRSNCVLPGFLETQMSQSLSTDQMAKVVRRTALQRIGSPDDVVGTILFLLSDESLYITGTEIVVDGGLSA